jgi:hypothetical protein
MPPSDTPRVFILGAGFSKAAGFPLADALTDEATARLRSVNNGSNQFAKLCDDWKALHCWLSGSGGKTLMNIEEFYEYAAACRERHLLAHYASGSHSLHDGTFGNSSADIRAYMRGVDDEVVNVLLAHHDRVSNDPASRVAIQRFVGAIGPGDTVVTFNYDCLVEQALQDAGMQWSFGLDDHCQGAIRVLKLHGSVDWICLNHSFPKPWPGDSRMLLSKPDMPKAWADTLPNASPDPAYKFDLHAVALNGLRMRDAYQHRQYEHGLAGLGPYKRPSRVPGLGLIWDQARAALMQADAVAVVGFSFPQFDRLAVHEIAGALASRHLNEKGHPRLVVVDPSLSNAGDGGLSVRAANVLAGGDPTMIRFEGVKHEDFDWASI